MAALARWCFRHRWTVVIAWLVVLVGVSVAARVAGDHYRDDFTLPGTDTQAAFDLLQQEFPGASGDTATIVLHARSGTLRGRAPLATATAMLARVAKLPHVAEVDSPFGARGAARTSPDGRTAFATVTVDGQATTLSSGDITRIVDTARAADGAALQVEVTGDLASVAEQPSQSYSELIGVVAAAVILFLAFGSLLATTLPLITALVALGISTNAVPLLSHLGSLSSLSIQLATLIGLGVGVDYALFIVNRHRIALRAGRPAEEAAVGAVNTSGRAVLFAGVTVCIALLGMFALGVTFLYGLAIAAALGVALTMAAAVTLLPALLGFYRSRVLSRRERRRLAQHGPRPEQPTGPWWKWAGFLERRPRTLAVLAAGAVVLVALPFFSLRMGSSDQGNGSPSLSSKRGYDLLAEGFGPGFNGPFTIVARTASMADLATLTKVSAALKNTPGVASVSPVLESPSGGATIVTLYPTTSPQDAATTKLLTQLRRDVIPAALGTSGTRVYVGGPTAGSADFSQVLQSKLPLFIAIVVVLAFLLLVAVFRSLLIPLTASAMNLLAVGAAFGVIVAVFQWGWGGSILRISPGPVEAFLPVLLFAVLFGLSMDYEVFLISRMHEEWAARRDNRLAITLGQAETGRVISAAGAIMIMVFLSFVLDDNRVIKEFGLGLSMAIVIDAFLIRTVLVPALMHVFGRANWWLPAPLARRLPNLSVEATPRKPAAEAAEPAPGATTTSPIPGQTLYQGDEPTRRR